MPKFSIQFLATAQAILALGERKNGVPPSPEALENLMHVGILAVGERLFANAPESFRGTEYEGKTLFDLLPEGPAKEVAEDIEMLCLMIHAAVCPSTSPEDRKAMNALLSLHMLIAALDEATNTNELVNESERKVERNIHRDLPSLTPREKLESENILNQVFKKLHPDLPSDTPND